jgi:hypothetical protein
MTVAGRLNAEIVARTLRSNETDVAILIVET